MKKTLLIVLLGFAIISCKDETPKNYVTLSGKISNLKGDTLRIVSPKNIKIKSIKISEDGSFKDTLSIVKGKYFFLLDKEYAPIYLRNGDDLHITLDTNQFDETLIFSGIGNEESNYMINKLLRQEELFNTIDGLYGLSKADFIKALDSTKTKFQSFLKEKKDFDTDFIQADINESENLFSYFSKRYDKVKKLKELVGKPSPIFVNYENHNGSTTSLSDLKGKYVYIDVWATWCNPCLKEIPALKELEKDLGDKMHFVSISVDKADKHEAWKQMVTEKELEGIQLYADNNWESQFVRDYGIDGIPRFIIIDPQGNVLKPDAPRPSSPKTKELFNKLIN